MQHRLCSEDGFESIAEHVAEWLCSQLCHSALPLTQLAEYYEKTGMADAAIISRLRQIAANLKML